ncbi:MAG: class I SAM-dependent methyltransferase [Cytophagales bacterium]
MLPLLLNLTLPSIPSNLTFERVPNPISDSKDNQLFGKIMVNGNEWTIDFNAQDEIWWVNPRPEPLFYEILYTKLFYSSPISEQFGYANLETDGLRRSEKAIKNWEDIEQNITIAKNGSILEIGCGSGEFLLEALKRGWKLAEGNELEKTSADLAIAKGLKIDTGFFENFTIEKGFDMLFADNVIEHTMQPLAFLEKAYQLTNSGGLIVLRLPDTQSFGPTLKLIDHTFHFTRKSIKTIVEMAGYVVETIFYSGTYKGSKYNEDSSQRIENMTVIAVKN